MLLIFNIKPLSIYLLIKLLYFINMLLIMQQKSQPNLAELIFLHCAFQYKKISYKKIIFKKFL